MRPPGTKENLERRRYLAVSLLKSGLTYRAVAERTGASLSSVVRWRQAHKKLGKKGLRSLPNPGRPPLLSDSQKRQLIRTLSKGPLDAGFATDAWTLKRIGRIIQKRFGVDYCVGNLWRVMDSLGWSCQKPSKRARERNEASIRYWKRSVWPHIKKGRRAWSPFGLPG